MASPTLSGMGMITKEFREFAVKGNVMDLAVGVMIGGAFQKIVNSLVNDIMMPPIGLLLGKVDFANKFVSLTGEAVATVADAKAKGIPTLNYGLFVNETINFVIIAFVLFLIVRTVNRMRRHEEGKVETEAKKT